MSVIQHSTRHLFKMASAQLTDDELFSELKLFGFTPGPVTENTRPVYLKKLKKFREEQQQRGFRPAKARSSGAINSNTDGGNSVGPRPVIRDVTHLSSSRRPGRKSSVLSFSSDESDADTPLKRKGSNQRDKTLRSSGFQLQPKIEPIPIPKVSTKNQYGGTSGVNSNSSSPISDRPTSVSPAWGVRARSIPEGGGRDYYDSRDENNHEVGSQNNSRSLNGCRVSHLNVNNQEGDYSDSDEETVWALSTVDRQRNRLQPSRSYTQASLSYPAVDRGSQTGGAAGEVNPPKGVNMVESQKGEGEEDKIKKRKSDSSGRTKGSINLYFTESYRGEADKNDQVDDDNHKAPTSNNTSRFTIGLRPRFSNYNRLSQTFKANHSNHTVSNHSYSQAVPKHGLSVPEDELLQQFKREEVASSGSFSAHYLSMFLLMAAFVFFLLLGFMYLRMRGSGFSVADETSKYLTKCDFEAYV